MANIWLTAQPIKKLPSTWKYKAALELNIYMFIEKF